MTGPMAGVRVVEFGQWVAGPSAAAILADWGAEVVKIEAHAGDPMRGFGVLPGAASIPPAFEIDNRGKRSIALDLRLRSAREVAAKLVARADVFITNARPSALTRSGLDFATLGARHPGLVYGLASAYGPETSERDRAAYDIGAFWARSGVAASLTYPGFPTPLQRPGMGDHNLAAQLAGGISAALFHRERTGEGQLVTTSLVRTATWTLAWDLEVALRTGVAPEPAPPGAPPNPLVGWYDTADGRRVWLLMLQGPRHWPDFARAVERLEWLDDPRYATWPELLAHRADLTGEIAAIIATRTLDEWADIFDANDVWWAPVQTQAQLFSDPVMTEAGVWTDLPTADGAVPTVASPVDFSATPWEVTGPVPALGQHTEELLLDLGYDWTDVGRLKDEGAIP